MSNGSIRPTTLAGIKRLARDLKAERAIPHHIALDLASKHASFENFRHAQHVLSVAPARPAVSAHPLWLSAYWEDKQGGSGRETLRLKVSAPLASMATPRELSKCGPLSRFKIVAPDHLVYRLVSTGQEAGRTAVCRAARALQFMSATGLRPATNASKAYPPKDRYSSIPGADHTSIWRDPATDIYLMADEPYELALPGVQAARNAWLEHHGYEIATPGWRGMYAPHAGARLYLVAPPGSQSVLHRVLDGLVGLREPLVEDRWEGESGPYRPAFLTPGQSSHGVKKGYAPPNPALRRSGPKTAGFVRMFVGPERRPANRMSVSLHAEVGRLLQQVFAATYHRKGVHNRVNGVRSTLDEWVQREYQPDELPFEQFTELYYHQEPTHTFARSLAAEQKQRFDANLVRVRQVLTENYNDCKPLRDLIKSLDAATSSLRAWQPKLGTAAPDPR